MGASGNEMVGMSGALMVGSGGCTAMVGISGILIVGIVGRDVDDASITGLRGNPGSGLADLSKLEGRLDDAGSR